MSSIIPGAHGEASHVEGIDTLSIAEASHAEGRLTQALGISSHSEGISTVAYGLASHASNGYTVAQNDYSTAMGKYNIGTDSNTILEVGIGISGAKANALEIFKDGKIIAPSLITISDPKSLVTKEYTDNITSGLEKITEDGGTTYGWRLIGQNPDNYGNIGLNAVDLSISGGSSTTLGATGEYSVTMGRGTRAQAVNSTAMGRNTLADGPYATAMGKETRAQGIYSTAMGVGTRIISDACTVLGMYNIGTTLDTILEVGIGADDSSRINAFEVYKDGKIIAPSLTTISDPKSLVTKEYTDNITSGLEKITEDGGTTYGWRLIGQNPDNYGNIGLNAVDLSISGGSSTSLGATGEYSAAIGYEIEASGVKSTAMGYYTTASGDYSTAVGSYSVASGTSSMAMGGGTASGYYSTAMSYGTASGEKSTAMGYDTTASGESSVAMGYDATASGGYSIAMGYHVTVIGVGSTAMGKYNIGTATDTILEVGIGVSGAKANALEVYNDGKIIAPSLTTISDPKSLVTKEYVDINPSPSGLEKITEDGGTTYGWRLIGQNPDNYGDIGLNAVDLSISDTASTSLGATGEYSVAMGRNTRTMNNYSTAMGKYNTGTDGETILEVGIGDSDEVRVNALEIYNDGRIVAPSLTTQHIEGSSKSLVSREYVDPKGGPSGERPVDPPLYTNYWDTGLGFLIVCTDNNSEANVWTKYDGTSI